MTERPVILLSFANQQDAYLKNLKKESSILNDVLSIHHDKGSIEVYREESASIDTIAKAIARFKERITVFHYAGHADGEHLSFEEGGANATGLAELLAQLPNLKFVFLNGCSTMQQVEYLLEKGIKAVIATAVPIDDEKAVSFAEHFYRAFANKNDIEAAFQFAVAVMRTQNGASFNATVVLKGEKPSFDDKNKMPWGLYLNEEPEKVLNWSIPTTFTTKVTRPAEVEFEVNRFMVDIVYEMIVHDPALKKLAYFGNEDAENDPVDDRLALSLIIEHFPWPIGVQIRLLATRDSEVDKPSIERIRQLVSTYVMTSQFLYYIVLSQLWDEKRERTLALRPSICDSLYNNQNNFNYFDYFWHFLDLVKLLKASNSSLFVAEFEEVLNEFEQKGEFYDAYLYMESLRSKINVGAVEPLEAEKYQFCADGEYFLSTILIKLAFLVNYDLITIRDIQVINHRHLETSFDHYIGRLNARVTDLAISRTPRARSFERFSNNASVILTKDMNNLDAFLNLSPFIVDKNAFGFGMTEDRATEQQLYMYAFKEDEEFKYLTTIHNIYRAQERGTDQFSTGDASLVAEMGGRRSKRVKRGPGAAEEPPLPFEVLKKQFELFEKNMLDK